MYKLKQYKLVEILGIGADRNAIGLCLKGYSFLSK